ncbi:EndoU domain-containing protein [Rathayibacter iranicus]|nr:EndoU domain-containing protein [Rathayibacter iranicus]MWV31336.1 hypothetical protein [Rathayibacter iranicus NCPPB 2253 = VKM Ac-1602]PWJ63685.1 RHS repeat-associated protein [Rathayibacter iranicus NCPPB 2253 = VKM Ac-1602]
MGRRAYDPTTRGFLSTDPVPPVWGAAWSGNPYSFAGNDPVHALDPAGLSPVSDAQLQAYRDGHNGAFAAAGDFLADNWEYIAGGAMALAGGALMFIGIGGPIGAALVGAGIDVIVQKATTGSVNWTQTALMAVTGGVGSSLMAARLSAAGINGLKAAVATEAASGAASGASGDAYAYASGPGPHTLDGFLQASGGGALSGAAMGAGGPLLGHGLAGAGRSTRTLLGKEADALTPDITTPNEPLNAVTPVPDDYVNLASPERTRHILDGEPGTNGGGHRFPGGKGKSLFPREWSDEKIMHEISDVATDPSLTWTEKEIPPSMLSRMDEYQPRFDVIGERDGVRMKVIIAPSGEGIITGYPIR